MMFKGDTVRLKVNFKDFEGNDVEPDKPTLTLYDNDEEEIDSIDLDSDNKKDEGVYVYDYTIPDDIQDFFVFEFRGEHNNNTILKRGTVKVKFSNP